MHIPGVNKLVYMKILIWIFSISFLSCIQHEADHLWKSVERDLSFTYSEPWRLVPTLDSKAQTLTGVIDYSDGKSYIIKMTGDVSKEKISDSVFHAEIKKTMLAPNKANRVIGEDDIIFHSQKVHRIVFFMDTEKWGLLKQISITCRNGKEYFSIQINYPIKREEPNKQIPESLVIFDKDVKINGK
jgi:hypothetical protein